MGSLPNLHQLSSNQVIIPIQNELLLQKLRNFEAYRNEESRKNESTNHAQIYHTRSLSSNPHEIKRKFSIDKNAGCRISRNARSSSVIPIQFHNIAAIGGASAGGGEYSRQKGRISRQASTNSTGTNSVRKLIGAVKSTPPQLGPVYTRHGIWQNFIALCLVHGMFTIAYMPVIILQSSISSWWWPLNNNSNNDNSNSSSNSSTSSASSSSSSSSSSNQSNTVAGSSVLLHDKITIVSGTGSLLCSGLYAIAAASSIASPFLSYKISVTRYLSISYAVSIVFFCVHLYPKLYLLIPTYAMMGVAIANINYTRTAYMITLASKLKFVLNDQEENELRYKSENARKETLVIRLFGWLALSKNIGLTFGGILTYFLIEITSNSIRNDDNNNNKQLLPKESDDDQSTIDRMPLQIDFIDDQLTDDDDNNNRVNNIIGGSSSSSNNGYDYRLCGYNRDALQYIFGSGDVDSSIENAFANGDELLFNVASLALPCKTSTMLAAVFTGCGVVVTVVSFAIIYRNRIRYQYSQIQRLKFLNILHTTYGTFKFKELQQMIPLMLFIGAEQGFMYADFIKLYVTCVTGVQTTPLIFISLGLLQSLAAVTLSLLLSHFQRYYIVVVGFIFQACLLLSLIMWKPKTDDIGLFYIISSAWGVCNAIWETLSFCLLLALFPDSWEFPFAHNDFFRHLGLSIAFVYHEHLCISLKLYIISFMLLTSIIPYTWLEKKLSRQQENDRSADIR